MEHFLFSWPTKKALKLLKELEELQLIKLISTEQESVKSISDRFAGKLSDKAAASLHQHVKNTREEWERDIWLIAMS